MITEADMIETLQDTGCSQEEIKQTVACYQREEREDKNADSRKSDTQRRKSVVPGFWNDDQGYNF